MDTVQYRLSLRFPYLDTVRRGCRDGGPDRNPRGGVSPVQGGKDVERAASGDHLAGSGNFPQGGFRDADGNTVGYVLGGEVPGILLCGQFHGGLALLVQGNGFFQNREGRIGREIDVIGAGLPGIQPAPFPVGGPDIRSQGTGDGDGGFSFVHRASRIIVRLDGNGEGLSQPEGLVRGVHFDGEFRLLVFFHPEQGGVQGTVRLSEIQCYPVLAQRRSVGNEQFQVKAARGVRGDCLFRENSLVPGGTEDRQRQFFSGTVFCTGIGEVRTEQDPSEPGRLARPVNGLAFQEETAIGVGGLVVQGHPGFTGVPNIPFSCYCVAVSMCGDAQEIIVGGRIAVVRRQCFYQNTVFVRGALHLFCLKCFVLPVAQQADFAAFHGSSCFGFRQEPEIAFRNGTANQHQIGQGEEAVELIAVVQRDGQEVPARLGGGDG